MKTCGDLGSIRQPRLAVEVDEQKVADGGTDLQRKRDEWLTISLLVGVAVAAVNRLGLA